MNTELLTQEPSRAVTQALDDIRQACELIRRSEWLRHAGLDDVAGDSLQGCIAEVMEAKAMLGEFEDCVAFQLAANELAESGTLEHGRGASRSREFMDTLLPARSKPGSAQGAIASGPETSADSLGDTSQQARADAMACLSAGYLRLYRKLRNRGREDENARDQRDDCFAKFDRLVAEMQPDDQEDFFRLEARYAARANRVHEQANSLARFWGLPDIPSPATSRVPPPK